MLRSTPAIRRFASMMQSSRLTVLLSVCKFGKRDQLRLGQHSFAQRSQLLLANHGSELAGPTYSFKFHLLAQQVRKLGRGASLDVNASRRILHEKVRRRS